MKPPKPDPWPTSCYMCGHPASWHSAIPRGANTCSGGMWVQWGDARFLQQCVCGTFHDPTWGQFSQRYHKPTLLTFDAEGPAQTSLI